MKKFESEAERKEYNRKKSLRQYYRIKSDPERYEEYKRKRNERERRRYAKLKEQPE